MYPCRYGYLHSLDCNILSILPLGKSTEILQNVATDEIDEFNVCAVPNHGISPAASAVNKLTFAHGKLFYNGCPVTAVKIADAIKKSSSLG